MTKPFTVKSMAPALLSLFCGGLVATSAMAQTQDRPAGTVNCNRSAACTFTPSMDHVMPTTLSLSVTADLKAAPDMATINFGVITQGRTAQEALSANNRRMNDVLAAMKTIGIEAKSIQTSNLNLAPQYVYVENQAPKITGYQVSDQVSVRVETISNLGPVVDAVTKAGVNQIDSISFDLKNDDALMDQARQDATKTLLQRAQLYAKLMGYGSVNLITLSEGSASVVPSYPQPVFMAKSADMSATPISGGELNRTITLNAVFELKK